MRELLGDECLLSPNRVSLPSLGISGSIFIYCSFPLIYFHAAPKKAYSKNRPLFCGVSILLYTVCTLCVQHVLCVVWMHSYRMSCFRLNKIIKDVNKFMQFQEKGPWPQNKVSALDRVLGEAVRILDKKVCHHLVRACECAHACVRAVLYQRRNSNGECNSNGDRNLSPALYFSSAKY